MILLVMAQPICYPIDAVNTNSDSDSGFGSENDTVNDPYKTRL